MQELFMGNAGRTICVAFATLLGGALCAQYRLQVEVVDSITYEPIPQAAFANEAGRALGRADEHGVLWFMSRDVLGDSITVSRFGYLRTSFRVPRDGGQVRIALLPEKIVLPEHAVHAAVPEVIFQSDSLHAAMFEPGADGLWVLAYAHPRMWRDQARAGQDILRDVVVVLLDTLLNEVARKPLPGECLGLHIGRRGEAYVIGTDRVWPIDLVEGRIVLKTMLSNVFQEAVKPWTDSIAGHWLGSDFDPTYPGFDHLAYQPVDDIVSVFCSVQDTFVMELFRSQYKYMSGHDKVVAMDAELRTGIDRQIWAGYMTGFQNDPYFHAPYAPSFIRHDTILVFDHSSGQLRRFTQHRVPIDVVPINYQQGRVGRTWAGRIMEDRTDGEVYALFESEGRAWLCAIDPATGQLGPKHMLEAKWPEQVRVHSGHAYYIHRPFESLQKRTLYRERLH
ncbi:MAG: hypothetical protein ABI599_12665 [Flavobacteriales bacterium]